MRSRLGERRNSQRTDAPPRVDGQVGEHPAHRWPWEEDLRGEAVNIPRSPDGRRLLLFKARTSSTSGREAERLVYNDMKNCLDEFRRMYGPDLLHVLPSQARLAEFFRESVTQRRQTRDGNPLRHRFVELDLRASWGVYLLFAMGSGRLLDNRLQQPSLERLGEVVRRVQPGLVFAKHIYRFGRYPWAFGPTVTELNYLGGYMGDVDRGIRRMESVDSVMLFFQATEGESEAKGMVPRSRLGMVSETDKEMANGVMRVGAPCQPPPGLARLRLRDQAGIGRSVVVLDSPAALPAETAVAYGMPMVFNDDGTRVDQVENVRWALSVFGTMRTTDVGRGLVERKFSTTMLRDRSTVDAVQKDPQAAASAVLYHLEFYRTGVFKIRLGSNEVPDIEVTGCFPIEGPWATEQRFAEIDAWLERRREIEASRSKTTFGGMSVTANGYPAQLRSYRYGSGEGIRAFRLLRTDAKADHSATNGLTVSHRVLADTIVEGIIQAGDRALALVPSTTVVAAKFEDELRAVEVRRDSITSQMRSIERQLDAAVGGKKIVTGALLSRLNDQYNDLASEADQLDVERARVVARMEAADTAMRARQAPALTSKLLDMIATLRDPTSLEYRHVWRTALRDVRIDSKRVAVAGVRGSVVEVRGEFRIGDGDNMVSLPFHHRVDRVSDLVDERVARLVDGMRDGVCPARSDVPGRRQLTVRLAAALGYAPRNFGMSHIQDPRLLRLAMAACRPADNAMVDAEQLAEQFGEPVELVRRVRDLWGCPAPPQQWRLPGAPALAALHVGAAANGGTTSGRALDGLCRSQDEARAVIRSRGLSSIWHYNGRDKTWTVMPCRWCESVALAPMLIREINGVLCLACWRDLAGVEWPASPYSHLIDNAERWRDAGWEDLAASPDPFKASNARTKPYRERTQARTRRQRVTRAAPPDRSQ